MDGPTLVREFAVLANSLQWRTFATAYPKDAVKITGWVSAEAAGLNPLPPVLASIFGKGLLGSLAACAMAAVTPPPPPPSPAPGPVLPTPTKILKAGQSFDALYPSLQGGDIVGVEPSAYPISSNSHNRGGGNGNPIWFVPTDPAHPPVLKGRFVTVPGGDNLRFTMIGFDGRNAANGPSWTLGSIDVEFDWCDLTNFNTCIGFHPVGASSGWGPAQKCRLTRSRVHDIGRLAYGSTNNDHGIYDESVSLYVGDVMIYNCSDRGFQERGGHGALGEYVTITHCGEGIIFGDVGAVGCTLRKSILTDRQVLTRALIEEYDPLGHDSSNAVTDVFAHNKDGGPVTATYSPLPVSLARLYETGDESSLQRRLGVAEAVVETELGPRVARYGGTMHSVTVTLLHVVDPLLDASMMPQLPAAAGYGCRVVPPKIVF